MALVVAVSLAPGCGSESLTESAPDPAEGIYGFLRGIVTRAGVDEPDLAAVVSAACDAYADGLQAGDTSSFDEYIADLFNVAEGGGLDQTRVDRAVTDACGSYDGDVRDFVDDLAASLGIGLDELRGYMATACADFAQRRRTNATDPHAPAPFDPLVSSVFAKGGLDRTDLGALVAAACGDFRSGDDASSTGDTISTVPPGRPATIAASNLDRTQILASHRSYGGGTRSLDPPDLSDDPSVISPAVLLPHDSKGQVVAPSYGSSPRLLLASLNDVFDIAQSGIANRLVWVYIWDDVPAGLFASGPHGRTPDPALKDATLSVLQAVDAKSGLSLFIYSGSEG